MNKIIKIEVVPDPKKPYSYLLGITWRTADGMAVHDESSIPSLSLVLKRIEDFKAENLIR